MILTIDGGWDGEQDGWMPRAEDSKGSAVSTWRWLVGYLMLQKKVFVPSLLALFVTAGLALAFPWFLKDLIGDPMNAMRSGVDAGGILAKVNHTIGWLLVVLAVQAVIGFFRVIGFIRSGEMAMNALRRDLFGHLVKLPVSIFMDTRPGELSNRISADLAVLRDTLLNTVPQAARQSVVLVGGLVVIVVTSMKLTLVMLVSVPVVVAAVALFGRKVRSRSRDAQDALAEASTVLEETTQGIFNVKTFNNQGFEAGRYECALEKFLGVTMRGALARAGFVSFIIFVLFGTIAGVIWYGAREMAHGTILPKELVAFILFSIFVGASLGSLPEILSQFQATVGATQRLRELMDTCGEREDGRVVGELRGDVRFEGVDFAYPSRAGSMILRDFSLHVPEAKRYAIVGPSGAGKSTLFSLLLGLYEPQGGEILVDGERLVDLNLGSFRSHVAIVPQEVMLFGGSIRENIGYGRQGASEEEIREAARLANVEEFVGDLPEGYETLVGARGMKLSGGQRQRIAIARAILANPRILLLDEATSALDAESERLIHEALERLMVGRTCLVIAHRLSTVRDADQIVVMQGGQIVEQGRHEELVGLRGAYHVLARTQLA